MRHFETIKTRLEINTVRRLERLTELKKDYFQYVLQDILDRYLDEVEREAYRKSFEYTIQIQEPLPPDEDIPF